MTAPDLTQPKGAPDQKARVLEWLKTEPGGLTQLQALQHLAVQRLAAVVYRLREDDGVTIRVELVDLPTRYGLARCARYFLGEAEPPAPAWRRPCPIAFTAPEPDPRPIEGPCECERPCETRAPPPRVDTHAMARELFGDQ